MQANGKVRTRQVKPVKCSEDDLGKFKDIPESEELSFQVLRDSLVCVDVD